FSCELIAGLFDFAIGQSEGFPSLAQTQPWWIHVSPRRWSDSQPIFYQITSLLRIQNNIDICGNLSGYVPKRSCSLSGTEVRPGLRESAILTIYGPLLLVHWTFSCLLVAREFDSYRRPAYIRSASYPGSCRGRPIRGYEQPGVSCHGRRSGPGDEQDHGLGNQNAAEK